MNGVQPMKITNLGQQFALSKKFCLNKYNKMEIELPENVDSVVIDQTVHKQAGHEDISILDCGYQLSAQLVGLDASGNWIPIENCRSHSKCPMKRSLTGVVLRSSTRVINSNK